MKSIYLKNKSKIILDKEHNNTALYEIELANLARIRIMLVILFIIEILFIAKNIILDQKNNQLNYLSNHDPLTGLLNRRYFMEQIEKAQEGKREPAAIVLVDIDFFKIVNDKYGHPVGDIVLKEVSSVLMKYINDNLAVRWGGEEFLLFLYNTSMAEACVFAETTRKSIEELTIEVNEFKIQTTASFGVASIDYENNFLFSSAYKAADIALYMAKNQGRNRVVKATV